VHVNAEAIHGSRPFTAWGDADTRYTEAADGSVFAIDLTNATERVFPALTGVAAMDGVVEWVERDDGLHVRAETAPPGSLARVYQVRPRRSARRSDHHGRTWAGEAIAGPSPRSAGDVVPVPSGIHQVQGCGYRKGDGAANRARRSTAARPSSS
jgi:hypothetical protein